MKSKQRHLTLVEQTATAEAIQAQRAAETGLPSPASAERVTAAPLRPTILPWPFLPLPR